MFLSTGVFKPLVKIKQTLSDTFKEEYLGRGYKQMNKQKEKAFIVRETDHI